MIVMMYLAPQVILIPIQLTPVLEAPDVLPPDPGSGRLRRTSFVLQRTSLVLVPNNQKLNRTSFTAEGRGSRRTSLTLSRPLEIFSEDSSSTMSSSLKSNYGTFGGQSASTDNVENPSPRVLQDTRYRTLSDESPPRRLSPSPNPEGGSDDESGSQSRGRSPHRKRGVHSSPSRSRSRLPGSRTPRSPSRAPDQERPEESSSSDSESSTLVLQKKPLDEDEAVWFHPQTVVSDDLKFQAKHMVSQKIYLHSLPSLPGAKPEHAQKTTLLPLLNSHSSVTHFLVIWRFPCMVYFISWCFCCGKI